MLESVDHWPMATLTSRPFGGKPPLVAAVRRDPVVGTPPLAGRMAHPRTSLLRTRIGVWRTVLWETQWGQLDSGREDKSFNALVALLPSNRCCRAVRGVTPSSVQLDPRSRGGCRGSRWVLSLR